MVAIRNRQDIHQDKPVPFGFSADTARQIESELKQVVSGEVRFDRESRGLYAHDSSNYRQVPIGVVVPRTKDDVIRAVEVCRRHQAPVLARGGGTSLAGQCCNVAVVFDFSKYMNRVLEIDPEQQIARVQPGTILDDLRDAAEEHHLTFGPDPATHDHCTLGGMIGNNSCGVHSIMSGRTSDNIIELEILTYDGMQFTVGKTSDDDFERIMNEGGRQAQMYKHLRDLRDHYADEIRKRYPDIPRRVSGYNLDDLLPENDFQVARALVGSESTCVLILEATVKLIESPPKRALLVLGYHDIYQAGADVMEIMAHGPTGLEGIDDKLIDYMKRKHLHPEDRELLPDGGGWLMVEFGGQTQQEAEDKARKLMDDLKQADNPPSMKLFDSRKEEQELWEVRESGLGATAHVPGQHESHPGFEDAAVPPEKVSDYLRDFRELLDKYDYACALYGHFGQGCIHVRIDFDLKTREGIDKYLAFINEAAHLVVSYGGSISGEHGDGQARGALLPIMYGDDLVAAFREFKSIWDPGWKMNPGKVVEPYRPDQNLRTGTDYSPVDLTTHFHYADEGGSFAKASLRCVGVGKCRRMSGGVMCPSFKATREEADSTRGRARLLFEMLEGDVVADGWKSDEVLNALDLCLACKGCKNDCPVNVDMATYKAEFLSHYYAGRLRPRAAYAMGLIGISGQYGSKIPGLANFFTQTSLLNRLAKLAAGVAQERSLPKFAEESFSAWFNRRPAYNHGRPQVMLWPDPFNDYFFPDSLRAAVEALERLGYQVGIPHDHVHGLRPLIHYGMLDMAKRRLNDVLAGLQADIRAGTPFICLEPSTASVFRDDLAGLLPNNEDANRLSAQTYTFSEFLVHEDCDLPKLNQKAILHGHCHHKSVLGMDDEHAVLQRLGIDYSEPESGCCGMAGSFGYESEHYDISMQIGEFNLLPAVRDAADQTLIIADGFSCREQIIQGAGREPLHLAQVVQLALREAGVGNTAAFGAQAPETSAWGKRALMAAGIAAVGAAVWTARMKGSKR